MRRYVASEARFRELDQFVTGKFQRVAYFLGLITDILRFMGRKKMKTKKVLGSSSTPIYVVGESGTGTLLQIAILKN